MWLKMDERSGQEALFAPCRYMEHFPVKQNVSYRVKVRFNAQGIEGPRDSSFPNYGFTIKTATGNFADNTGSCNDITSGNVIGATYNASDVTADPNNPGWSYLKGTFNSGTSDFLPYLYLTFNNAKDTTGDGVGGHVFIDSVSIEESTCPENSGCLNVLSKPSMSAHTYISQKDALLFDRVLDLAHENNIYLKAVMNEKNDRIFQTIDKYGQPVSTPNVENFYGDGRNITKVRWLQQAWWRYIQARWGYSTNIHSWELLK